VVIRPGDTIPEAPLYVKYVPKVQEYRVHVYMEKVLFVQQKRRVNGAQRTANQNLIRSHENGWVYTIQNIEAPQSVLIESLSAVAALNLDFGAVDCIVGRDDDEAYVLEVNTAPGLQSPTLLNKYVSAFKEDINL
jgi:glutathione synthase/RimK-type ligase-like ATP-grasp enzyme